MPSPESTLPDQNGTSIQFGLKREIGLLGAIALGLGAILGTGVFVTVVVAAEKFGINVLTGIALAAVTAICNGLSSARLAAAFPVSGGTYEYACRLLDPRIGFAAGWLFLCAKIASAAAAALGTALYIQALWPTAQAIPVTWIALLCIAFVGALAIGSVKLTNVVNIILVTVTLVALSVFIASAIAIDSADQGTRSAALAGAVGFDYRLTLSAAAWMFVAFTGYGRIATLGEEVQNPSWTIPRGVIGALLIAALIYLAVAWVVLELLPSRFAALESEVVARLGEAPLVKLTGIQFGGLVYGLVATGAVTAMMAVELNLVLGLSRVVLAMSRRGDLPVSLEMIHPSFRSPQRALLVVLFFVMLLTCFGTLEMAWEFSALTILVYYAITNLCAMYLCAVGRLFKNVIGLFGLILTLSLACFVPMKFWGIATIGLALGFVIRRLCRQYSQRQQSPQFDVP